MNKSIFIIFILVAIIVLQNTGFLKTINNLDIVKVNILTIFKSKNLDLSNQGLKTVPSYVFEQTNLENLNISHNSLSGTIPAEIKSLINLKTLNASNNIMSGVPAEIGQLKNLEVIDFCIDRKRITEGTITISRPDIISGTVALYSAASS